MENNNKKPSEENLVTEQVKESLEKITEKKEKKIPGIHTFAQDIANTAQDQKMSVIKIALAEQKRREEFTKNQTKIKNKNFLLILLSTFLIIGGFLLFVFFSTQEEITVPLEQPLTSTPGSFIFTESQQIIDLDAKTRPQIINLLSEIRADTQSQQIESLLFTEGAGSSRRRMTSANFLNLISPNFNPLIYNYIDQIFMFGNYGGETAKGFMIIQTHDYPNLLNQLRSWEAFMFEDLTPILGSNNTNLPETIFTKELESEFLFNKEARVLRDDANKFVFAYVTLDPKTILFVADEDGAKEIITRYENQSIR